MKIYLLVVLIGTLLTAIHFTSTLSALTCVRFREIHDFAGDFFTKPTGVNYSSSFVHKSRFSDTKQNRNPRLLHPSIAIVLRSNDG